MSVPNLSLTRQQLALRDHSLAVNAPMRELVVHAVTEEKCAGGHLAQILAEDQDLLPRLHPRLLLEVALTVLKLMGLAVHLRRALRKVIQQTVDVSKGNMVNEGEGDFNFIQELRGF